MTISDYVLRLLDQADEDDQLIDADDVARIASRSLITDKAVLTDLAYWRSDMEVADDGLFVSFTMTDLYDGAADTSLLRTVYQFSPRYYVFDQGRSVAVNSVVASPSTFTYDEFQGRVTFGSQQALGAEVVLSGLLVSYVQMLQSVVGEIVAKVETAPDIYGGRNKEYADRLRRFKAREFTAALP